MNLEATGIRLEGTEERIEECLRRLRHVLDFSYVKYRIKEKKGYEIDCEEDEEEKYAFIQAYFDHPNKPESNLDKLEAAYWDIQCLQEAVEEAELEIQRLKAEKPRPFDAVLGGNLQQNTRSNPPL